jgi:hypothetical protein
MTHTPDPHAVISAFLDDEPFEPQALAAALSEPAGRTLLIDLVALRHIVQPEAKPMAAIAGTSRWRSTLRYGAAAAAIVVALVGGYVAGDRNTAPPASEPPAPTRVVQPQGGWQLVPEGGLR